MPRVRFNHAFTALLLASALCAFCLPPRYADDQRGRLGGKLSGIFEPVAWPLRRLAGSLDARLRPRHNPSPGSEMAGTAGDPVREMDRLRSQVALLTIQNTELRQLNANRELAGDAAKFSLPLKVISGDLGTRDTLWLHATASDGVSAGMPVLLRDGIVGRISAVGSGGAQVRLITDRESRVSAAFGRFQRAADGSVQFVPIGTPPPLVEGKGGGVMSISNLTLKQIQEAGVREQDWVVLRDEDWPLLVNGYFLGCIKSIEEHPKAKLFAEVTIQPRVSLRQLREVMVVTGRPSSAVTPPPAVATGAPATNPPPKNDVKTQASGQRQNVVKKAR